VLARAVADGVRQYVVLGAGLDTFAYRNPHPGLRVARRHASMTDRPLSEDQRKEVFLALVDAQDHDMGVVQSRQHVAARFGVSEQQVRRIEREGLDNGWPPL
jgi:hypothetical protein